MGGWESGVVRNAGHTGENGSEAGEWMSQKDIHSYSGLGETKTKIMHTA